MITTGEEMSVTNEIFINEHEYQFVNAPILPVNETDIHTGTDMKGKVNKQMYVYITNDEWSLKAPVIVENNLIYDVIRD